MSKLVAIVPVSALCTHSFMLYSPLPVRVASCFALRVTCCALVSFLQKWFVHDFHRKAFLRAALMWLKATIYKHVPLQFHRVPAAGAGVHPTAVLSLLS